MKRIAGLENWELEKMIEKIIKDNTKEVPFEGTEVDKRGLMEDIKELIKDLATPINEHDSVQVKVEINGIPVGTVGTVVHVYDENKAFEVEFTEERTKLEGLGNMVITYERKEVKPYKDEQ